MFRLCSEVGPEAENIKAKKAEIQGKWKNLQGDIHSYRDRLSIAANIQAFQVAQPQIHPPPVAVCQ